MWAGFGAKLHCGLSGVFFLKLAGPSTRRKTLTQTISGSHPSEVKTRDARSRVCFLSHIWMEKKDPIFCASLVIKQKKNSKRRSFCFIVQKKTNAAVKWRFTYPCWRGKLQKRTHFRVTEQNLTKINTFIFKKWNPDFTAWKTDTDVNAEAVLRWSPPRFLNGGL